MPIDMPDYQGTFDQVCGHLIAQDSKSEDGGEGTWGIANCLYRSECGTKSCAAGCLILNDQYSPAMEGATIFGDQWPNSLVQAALTMNGHDLTLVQVLQHVHDGYPVADWKNELRKVARVFKLACPPCLIEESTDA